MYANQQVSPGKPEHDGAVDAWLEGITAADQDRFDRALEEVLSPHDREVLAGASNGGYHYFGSAKIFAQANLKLIKK